MADIETSVVISAQTDDLQSGMETAANSVQAATDAMRARFADMVTTAQQAQLQISGASARVGSSIGDLQEKTASLARSIGDGITPNATLGYGRNQQQLDEQAWDDTVAPIERAVDRSVTGIILGTTTVQKALANLAQSIVAEFVNSAVKGVLGQIGNLWGGSNLSGGQDFSGGIIGGFFKGISTLFGFQHGGIVPSAQGGWAVPSLGAGGVFAQLHSNEMVLPATISQGLQSMLGAPLGANGSGGGGSGSIVVNVSAIDSQDVKRFFHSNGSLLVAALNKATRNGSLLRTA